MVENDSDFYFLFKKLHVEAFYLVVHNAESVDTIVEWLTPWMMIGNSENLKSISTIATCLALIVLWFKF